MNINGFISRNELENAKTVLKNAYKSTRIFFFLKTIFFVFYFALVALLLLYGIMAKHGMPILICTGFVPVVIYNGFYNHKTNRQMKKHNSFAVTDMFLGGLQEYSFVADEEKVVLNESITVYYNDAAICAVFNGYTVLTDKNGVHIVIKTDIGQQWQLFLKMKELDIPVTLVAEGKGKPFPNGQILDYYKNIGLKKKAKKKRKVFLASVAVTAVIYGGMVVWGNTNNISARDTTVYSYDETSDVYFISQMMEKYDDTKSYKPMLDIYFDWAAKKCQSVVAVTASDGHIGQMDIFFRDENNNQYYVRYTDSPEKYILLIDFPFDENIAGDWESEIKQLSNYSLIARKYPYIIDVFTVLGFDIEMVMKDSNIFTLSDNAYIFFTPSFYSCGDGDNDYYYVVSVSEQNVEEPDVLYDYFLSLAEKYNSIPYEQRDIDMNEIKTMLEKHCKVSVAE